jgi:hypothetical protein
VIETGIISLLNNSFQVASLCGSRIFPDPMPENEVYPAITYMMIGARPDPTLDTSGYQRHRVEFRCRAENALEAIGLREALRNTLEGYNGVLTDGTFLQDVQFINLMDSFVENPRLYERTIEFYFFFCFPN